MPGGFFVYRAGGEEEIIYANNVMVSIFGCDSYADFMEYTGHSFRGIVCPDDYVLINHSIEVQIRNDNIHFDHVTYRIRRKDGQIRRLNDYGRLVELEGYGKVFYVFVADETEDYDRPNNSTQAMKAIDGIHLALGSGDWSMTFSENGEMTDCTWSARFRQMLGYSSIEEFPDELSSWSDLLVEEDKERVLKHYWDVVFDYTDRKTYDIYYRMITKDRGIRWFRAIGRLTRKSDGRPIIFYGIFLDVDAEKRRQIAEKNQNNAILEAVSREYHTMWLITKKDLKMHFLRSNGIGTIQNAVNMGMGDADYNTMINQYVDTYVVENDRERVREAVTSDAVLEDIRHKSIYTVNYRRKDDGGRVTFHQMAFTDTGEGFILAYHDIDETMRDELNQQMLLRDALTAAQSANHAKSVFLQTMSHDIRTPLNGILGMTEIARNHIGDTERITDSLEKIDNAGHHLLTLVNEVLDLSKIESGNLNPAKEEIAIDNLIDDTASLMQPEMEFHHHEFIITKSQLMHEHVIGDFTDIQKILTNLLANSVKYTPDGGQIEFAVRELPCNQTRTGCYEFTVRDTGIGMSEEFTKRIFEPFLRAEDGRISKIQVTGLGMTITKLLVDTMGEL